MFNVTNDFHFELSSINAFNIELIPPEVRAMKKARIVTNRYIKNRPPRINSFLAMPVIAVALYCFTAKL